MIAEFAITDAATYREYEKGFFPVLKSHGGSFLTYDDAPIALEGADPTGRMVIFTFPSEAAARGWFDSAEYQEIAAHRRAGTDLRSLMLVHGTPPR